MLKIPWDDKIPQHLSALNTNAVSVLLEKVVTEKKKWRKEEEENGENSSPQAVTNCNDNARAKIMVRIVLH